MTFEEYYTHYEIHSGDYMNALKHAWDCACKVQEKRIDELEDELHCVRAYNDELISKLKLIEDAIAFELGGEPCGLHEAHKLVKAMIQSSNRQASGGEQ